MSNVHRLREAPNAPTADSSRLQKKRDEADKARQNGPELDKHYAEDQPQGHAQASTATADEETMIDPQLMRGGSVETQIRYAEDSFIDPILRNDSHSAHFPDGSGVLNRDSSNYPDPTASHYPEPSNGMDYNPSPTDMYPPSLFPHNEDGEYLQDSGGEAQETDSTSKKKKKRRGKRQDEDDEEIAMDNSNRRRTNGESQVATTTKTDASRQYLREKERKALEDARKKGRFILVSAALRGRKKIVKLRISPDKLARIVSISRETPDSPRQPSQSENILLQSDVVPQKQQQKPATTKSKPQTQFRYRVEEDKDFRSRKRRDRQSATGPERKRKRRVQYEEVDILDEDDEVDGDESAPTNAGAARRRSEWLKRKQQDDADLPDELPEDWKDGRAAKRRRSSAPAPVRAQKRPRIRPANGSTGGLMLDGPSSDADADADADADGIEDDDSASLQIAAEAVQIATNSLVEMEREAEANRQAKLEAAKLAGDEMSSKSRADDTGHNYGKSILLRAGNGAKKIRIVSAVAKKKKQQQAASGFTAVNTRG